MTRTVALGAVAGIVGMLALSGCSSAGPSATWSGAPPTLTARFPVTVGAVKVAARPARIVSLSASATDMLFAIGAGPQVIAADDASTFPATAPTTVLSAVKPDAAAVDGYKPDLVVLYNDTSQIADQLRSLGVPTLVAPAATTVDDTYAELRDIGALTGHPAEAAAVAAYLRDELAGLTRSLPQRAKPLSYYYEMDDTLYSATSKSFIGSLLASVGLVNVADPVAGDNPYPQLSPQAVMSANPDLIFLADATCCHQSPATVASRAGWNTVTAVRNGQVIVLDEGTAAGWGPRVVDVLRTVVAAIGQAPAG